MPIPITACTATAFNGCIKNIQELDRFAEKQCSEKITTVALAAISLIALIPFTILHIGSSVTFGPIPRDPVRIPKDSKRYQKMYI